MIKFKDFKYKRTATDQPNVNVDNAADAPQAVVGATAAIHEGKVVTLNDNPYRKVYINPSKSQAQNMGGDSYRTMHDGKNLYMWKAHDYIHPQVADRLGVDFDKSTRSYFTHNDLSRHGFDAYKAHNTFHVKPDKPRLTKPATEYAMKHSTKHMDAESYYDHFHMHESSKVAHMKLKYLKKDSEGERTTIHKEFEPVNEGSVPKDWRLRDVEKHLKKRGFSEDRHSGGHKIFSHPQKGTISVPAHPTAYISPGVIRKVFDISENADDQMLVPPNKGKKTFMKKATNVPAPSTGKYSIGTVVSGDGEIGVSS